MTRCRRRVRNHGAAQQGRPSVDLHLSTTLFDSSHIANIGRAAAILVDVATGALGAFSWARLHLEADFGVCLPFQLSSLGLGQFRWLGAPTHLTMTRFPSPR